MRRRELCKIYAKYGTLGIMKEKYVEDGMPGIMKKICSWDAGNY